MKAILFATAAAFVAITGAHAAEEYPTPITRPIMTSTPVLDVNGGGPWQKQTIVTGAGGLASMTGSEAMPTYLPPTSGPVLVQHGTAGNTHG